MSKTAKKVTMNLTMTEGMKKVLRILLVLSDRFFLFFFCACGQKGLDPPPRWPETLFVLFCFAVFVFAFVPISTHPPPWLETKPVLDLFGNAFVCITPVA